MVLEPKVIRFLICGGLAAFINWAARIALSPYLPFIESIVAAYLVGMIAGFILYRMVVWPASGKDWHQQLTPFIVVNLMGAGVVLISTLALVQVASIIGSRSAVIEAFAHGAAIAIGAAFNFYGHNRFTFSAADR